MKHGPKVRNQRGWEEWAEQAIAHLKRQESDLNVQAITIGKQRQRINRLERRNGALTWVLFFLGLITSCLILDI